MEESRGDGDGGGRKQMMGRKIREDEDKKLLVKRSVEQSARAGFLASTQIASTGREGGGGRELREGR